MYLSCASPRINCGLLIFIYLPNFTQGPAIFKMPFMKMHEPSIQISSLWLSWYLMLVEENLESRGDKVGNRIFTYGSKCFLRFSVPMGHKLSYIFYTAQVQSAPKVFRGDLEIIFSERLYANISRKIWCLKIVCLVWSCTLDKECHIPLMKFRRHPLVGSERARHGAGGRKSIPNQGHLKGTWRLIMEREAKPPLGRVITAVWHHLRGHPIAM